MDTDTKQKLDQDPYFDELVSLKHVNLAMTNKPTDRARKQSQLVAKTMNSLAEDMAQLIDDPGVETR